MVGGSGVDGIIRERTVKLLLWLLPIRHWLQIFWQDPVRRRALLISARRCHIQKVLWPLVRLPTMTYPADNDGKIVLELDSTRLQHSESLSIYCRVLRTVYFVRFPQQRVFPPAHPTPGNSINICTLQYKCRYYFVKQELNFFTVYYLAEIHTSEFLSWWEGYSGKSDKCVSPVTVGNTTEKTYINWEMFAG
jgi:hypothetical protein